MLACSTLADADTDEAFKNYPQLSGFATLGLTYNDNKTAKAITSLAQTQPADYGLATNLDSVVGLQMDCGPCRTHQ